MLSVRSYSKWWDTIINTIYMYILFSCSKQMIGLFPLTNKVNNSGQQSCDTIQASLFVDGCCVSTATMPLGICSKNAVVLVVASPSFCP